MDNTLDNRTETTDGRESHVRSMKDYFSNHFLLIELLVCLIFVATSTFIPSLIFRMNVFERDIPYLSTENGDIILDQTINRPLVDSQAVPEWLLILLCPVFTAVVVSSTGYFFGPKGDTHAAVCALMLSVGCSEFITSFIKLYVGYLRPNFYSRCEFSVANVQCESEDNNILIDARRSFPSGHASLSFSCMAFLSLFFFGKVGLHRLKATHIGVNEVSPLEVQKYYLKKRALSMIATTPISLAVLISASRVRDDWHHPADIVCGSLIGLLSARFCYGLWYNDISAPFAGVPLLTSSEKMRLTNFRSPIV